MIAGSSSIDSVSQTADCSLLANPVCTGSPESDPVPGQAVLMMPDYRGDNPFQTLLTLAVESEGCQVRFPVGYRRGLPLFRALRDCPGTQVLHLHWTSPYLKGSSRVGFFLSMMKFVIDLALVRMSGVRIVWTLHNLVPHEARFRRLEVWTRQILCRLASTVIVHGSSGKQQARTVLRCPVRRIAVIPLGNYRGVYGQLIERNEARKRLGLAAGIRVFLFFGFIRPYKGLEQLLRVWRALAPQDACLLIAGKCLDTRFGTEIDRLAAETPNVRLVRQFIRDAEVPDYFSAADVVVLPFVQVQTSASVLLAMGYGKPVIASNLGEIPETLRGAEDLLFEAGDEESLRQKLAQARDADLEDLGRRTAAACDRLDWTSIGRATAQVYFPSIGRRV